MGNRAVITVGDEHGSFNPNGIGIYLHWNGGRDSVQAFLKYCDLHGYRSPSSDNYGWASLCQVISNFFGGGDSIGVDKCCNLDCDNGDNGVFTIQGWEIVGRKYSHREQNQYELDKMLIDIDKAQPEQMRIGEFIQAEHIEDFSQLQIGDEIVWIDWANRLRKGKIIGFGADRTLSCRDCKGVPYMDAFGDKPEDNPNNYLWSDSRIEYRLVDKSD